MKKKFLATAFFGLVLFCSLQSFAQKKQNYIPEKGYWQLVTNIHDKKTVTVQFYEEGGAMIYKETLTNARMNPSHKKVRRQLYYALKDAYQQWTLNRQITATDLIAKRK